MTDRVQQLYDEAFALEVRECQDALRAAGGSVDFEEAFKLLDRESETGYCQDDYPVIVGCPRWGSTQPLFVKGAKISEYGTITLSCITEDDEPCEIAANSTKIDYGHLQYVTAAINNYLKHKKQ